MRASRRVTAMVLGFMVLPWVGGSQAQDKKVDPVALERTREQVRMLDDLYKNAVVAVTANYVSQQADTPAAAVAKQIFEAMHKKGWHNARLIDVTGKPKSKENVAKTDFEKKAAAEILAGKALLEEIAEVGGKPVLRTATIVPSVMKQCAICHGGKEGRPLGAIIYELPIK